MSTIVSESNLVEKCHSKIVDENESKEGNKNGFINGLVHKKHKALSTEAIEICKDVSKSSLSDVNNVGKSRRSKKKKHKEQLDSNENLNESKIDENSHTKSMDYQNESFDNSDGSAVSGDINSPSCSKISHSTNDDQCDPLYISNNIDKLVISKVDNFPDEQKRQCDKKIEFVQYESELQMPLIMKIIQKDLSEPYSIYTYRYFIHNWPKLCFLAMCEDQCVGAIVCKLDLHRKIVRRGYIAMLAVDQNYRKLRIGSTLVQMAIHEMTMGDADEVVLETEVTNKPALKLYEKLGFVRDKRLFRYYLNGVDALRLKLWLR